MSVQVKKAYKELYELLQANESKKVSTIMPQLVELMTKKGGGMNNGKNYITDEEGNVTHVFCYYHKKWESVAIAEYGKKTNTATGLNTMCKEGTSAWNKAQRVKKQAEANILIKIQSGELQPEDIANEQIKIAEQAKVIEPRDDEHGWDNLTDIE